MKKVTARDIPQVLELLSPKVRALNLGSNFFCFTQAKGNWIGDEGATAIADMLKTNSTLTEIDLAGE